MKAVKGYRYLYRRGDQLYFRRRVPLNARAAFDGREEVQKSLGTGNIAEARHLLAIEVATFDKMIAKGGVVDIEVIRQRALGAIAPLKPADAMTSVPHAALAALNGPGHRGAQPSTLPKPLRPPGGQLQSRLVGGT